MSTNRVVCLFDDDPAIRQLLRTLLERRGWRVRDFDHPGQLPSAAGGGCCSQAGGDCQAVITDVNMPEVPGLEFVERLMRVRYPTRRVAMMSGAWHDDQMDRAKAYGVETFEKPIDTHLLDHWLTRVEADVAATG